MENPMRWLLFRRILPLAFVLSMGFLVCPTLVLGSDNAVFEIDFASTPFPYWGRPPGSLGVEEIAQKYIPQVDQTVCAVKQRISGNGTPNDDMVLTVWKGGAVPGGGARLGETALPGVSLPTYINEYTAFVFNPCLKLEEGTTYWFHFHRSIPLANYSQRVGQYQSGFRPSNQYNNTSYWTLQFFGPYGWAENTNREWSLRLEGPTAKEPVIIIPGILGSELGEENNLLWPNLARMFFDINDEFLSSGLALDSNGNSFNKITVGNTITSLLHIPALDIDIFENLKNVLVESGYELNSNLFFFPYDWRLDLDKTIISLNQKIEDIKNQTGYSQVNIIAHSMGGLLAKDYINAYGKESIDKLIFVGTPHLGAPKAGKTILFGDRFGIPWLEEDAMRDLSRNAPAVYELLPNPTYFDQFIGYINKFASVAPLNYDETKDFLLANGATANIFDIADQFFSKDLQDNNLDGINVYNIAGCKSATQAGYLLNDKNDDILIVGYTSGDETVPLVSAGYISTLNKYYFKNADHTELPSEEDVRNAVSSILQDSPIALTQDFSNSNTICDFKGKELLWRSPVEVHIYDGEGNHTGPIENNAIEYGIAGVDYEIIGHRKFIFLPTNENQQYHVIAKGEEEGSFDLMVRENNNGEVTSATVFNDVPVNAATEIKLDISEATGDSSIQVDENGNGNFEIIPAFSRITGGQSDDVDPPEIIILNPEAIEYTRPEAISIDVLISDPGSGIATQNIALDGVDFGKTNIDLFSLILGPHVLSVGATDLAGNSAQASVRFQVITTFESAIKDIQKALDLGWLTKESTAKHLIDKLEKAIKEEDKAKKNSEKKIDKILGTELTKELEKEYEKGNINDSGYNIIKEDVDWLINN